MRRALPLCLVLVLISHLAMADDGPIEKALARPILGPGQTLAEVQEFVEPRIPAMPQVKTAAEWTARAKQYREDVHKKVLFRGEAERWRAISTRPEWLGEIEGGPGYRIKKLRFEVVPGLWIPALLYEPTVLRGKVPVVLNVNGHDAKGKAADYKQIRCINQAKRGILALNLEWFGMGQLGGKGFGHGLINAVDLCGTSGIALHYLAMSRGIDILLSHENADPSRVGVTGLSGGGWQTIFVSSLDSRVTLTDPVAGYSSYRTRMRFFSDLGDSEQTPCDLGTVVDYAHLTAMMAPHPTLLTFNGKDNCCFAAPHALPPLIEAAGPIFRLFGVEGNLRAHVNFDPGTHNYGLDNRQAFYQMISDHWSRPDQIFNPREIPSDAEVKTAEALKVELPKDNLTIQTLAQSLAEKLPKTGETSGNGTIPGERSTLLRSIVRPVGGDVSAEKGGEEESDGITRTFWKVKIGQSWTIPAVELARGKPEKGTTILFGDEGRAKLAAHTSRLLGEGRRVIAIDPYAFGEAVTPSHGYLFSLMIATIGERALGVDCGQVAAVARWRADVDGAAPTIESAGPRTSTIAIVAAAMEPKAIGSIVLHRPLGSLKEILDSGQEFSSSPEQFCFGLLTHFDLREIIAMIPPQRVSVHDAGESVKRRLLP
ncbi:MAG: hypothetical protein JWN86_3406 [Planctomycetota bacterium]|nr:hypothetical protein [Planctomycetota bacterium]